MKESAAQITCCKVVAKTLKMKSKQYVPHEMSSQKHTRRDHLFNYY